MSRRAVPAAGALAASQMTAAHGLFRPATHQWHRPRLDLWPDRHRLHHGLWHRRHDQFRPWRHFHDRRFHRADLVFDPGLDRADRGSRDPLDRASGVDGHHRALWLDGRAHRLPAAAALVPPGADAVGDRHVLRIVKFCAGGAGRTGETGATDHHRRLYAAGPERIRGAAFQCADHRRHHHHRAAVDFHLDGVAHPAWPRHARLRAGPDHGGAARRRRRPHHLDDLRHWICARRRRRHDVPVVLRPCRFLHGLRRRYQSLHRRRARRHRLIARRDAGRTCDRADRNAVVGLFLGGVQGRRGVLDPDHRADLHADRPARPARSRKSLTGARVTVLEPTSARRAPGAAFIFKKALISALVALVLFSLMIGIRTEAGPTGQLIYWTRFGDLAALVAAVFAGSIAVELLRWRWGPVGMVRIVPPGVTSALALARRAIAPLLLIFALLVPVIFYDQRYILDLGILVLTYVMLGWGLNVVVGLAGLLDLGYVAFYAVGAYSYALLATNFGLSFWICLPLAGILASLWGVMLGFPVLRLRGDYLAIVTLAFGEIIRLVIINWQSLTGGPNGVSGIPRPSFFGIPLTPGDDGLAAKLGIEFSTTHRIVFLFYIILALALLTNWVTIRLRRLPIGRAWEALREDEVACRAIGINITTTKLTAFATGAMFGGFAGAFFATRQGFISPESFTFQESALVLAIVVLGGMGSQLGVALAALTMIGGFELFRGLEQYRMLVFGAAMVLLMIWRPRGLIGHRAPTVFLRHAQAISSDLVKEGHG